MKEPLIPRDVVTVSGTEFFGVRKTDSAMVRAFTGTSWGKTRPLKDSPVIATIARLRDDAIANIVSPPATVDLNLDEDTQPRKRPKAAQNIEVVTVSLPPVGNIGEVRAKVLNRKQLFVECSSEVVNWLAAAFAESFADERDGCDDDDGEPDNDQLPKYVYFDKGRNAHRVRYNGTVKWFSQHTCEDSLGAAVSFLATLQKSELDVRP
jgi:hypothetical protein